jgi:hypothetical protein
LPIAHAMKYSEKLAQCQYLEGTSSCPWNIPHHVHGTYLIMERTSSCSWNVPNKKEKRRNWSMELVLLQSEREFFYILIIIGVRSLQLLRSKCKNPLILHVMISVNTYGLCSYALCSC